MKVNIMTSNKKTIMIIIASVFLSMANVSGLAAEKRNTILIDPAHGGSEKGLIMATDVYEKNITLAIALLVKDELFREKNVDVILLRDTDKTMNVQERRKYVERIKPAFFLGIHVNGGFGKNASGFEIYYPEYHRITTTEKSARNDTQSLKHKLTNNSLTMARILQDNLNILFPRKGRGLRQADNPATLGLQVPSVIVEVGFGTNQEDIKKLNSKKTQSDVAKAIANSIKKYFR